MNMVRHSCCQFLHPTKITHLNTGTDRLLERRLDQRKEQQQLQNHCKSPFGENEFLRAKSIRRQIFR